MTSQTMCGFGWTEMKSGFESTLAPISSRIGCPKLKFLQAIGWMHSRRYVGESITRTTLLEIFRMNRSAMPLPNSALQPFTGLLSTRIT